MFYAIAISRGQTEGVTSKASLTKNGSAIFSHTISDGNNLMGQTSTLGKIEVKKGDVINYKMDNDINTYIWACGMTLMCKLISPV